MQRKFSFPGLLGRADARWGLDDAREGVPYPPVPWFGQNPAFVTGVTYRLDALNDRLMAGFRAPRTGSITHLAWFAQAVATGATLDVRLETIDATGAASGSLWATNTNASETLTTSTDNGVWKKTALTSPASVTAGDSLAVVWQAPGAGSVNITIGAADALGGAGDERNALFTGGSWNAGDTAKQIVVLYYADGTILPIYPHVPLINAIASQLMSSSSNPNYAGLLLTVKRDVWIRGVFLSVVCSGGSAGQRQGKLHLIGPDGVTKLLSGLTLDGVNSPGTGMAQATSPRPIRLTAGKRYRVVYQATGSQTTNSGVHYGTAPSQEIFDAWFPNHWGFTQAQNPTGEASWTQTALRRAFGGLILAGCDDNRPRYSDQLGGPNLDLNLRRSLQRGGI